MSSHLESTQRQLARLTQERVEHGVAPGSVITLEWGQGTGNEQRHRSNKAAHTAAGFGDIGDGEAPDHNTVFRIASCTKSFTAVRALQLRDSGLLDLDRPITELLPYPVLIHSPQADSPVPTPRMLLTMSGGLPTDDAWADRLEAMPGEDFDAMLSRGIRLVAVPGTTYEYANLGWAILGRIMEYLDGRPLTTQVEREVLDPLGLDGVRFTPPPGRRIAQGFAKRSTGWQSQRVTAPGAFSAIGGLFASGSDLLHWMDWLASAFSDKPGPHDGVLSAASRREMQQLHRANPVGAPGVTSGYGYGVVVEHSDAEGHVVSHSGGYPGFSAHMRWSLDHGLRVCGLENAGYAGVHRAVRKTMSELLTGSQAQSVIAWPETQSAVARVRQLLENPGDQLLWERAESELFDSCVALDLPIRDRRDQIIRLQAAGDAPLTQTSPAFPTPASAHWELRGNPNTLQVTLQMTPLNPPRVQRIDVSLSEADTPT